MNAVVLEEQYLDEDEDDASREGGCQRQRAACFANLFR
jgi:hypothetical protein